MWILNLIIFGGIAIYLLIGLILVTWVWKDSLNVKIEIDLDFALIEGEGGWLTWILAILFWPVILSQKKDDDGEETQSGGGPGSTN